MIPPGKFFCKLVVILVFLVLAIQTLAYYYDDSGFQRAAFFFNSANNVTLTSVSANVSHGQKLMTSTPALLEKKATSRSKILTSIEITTALPTTVAAIKTTDATLSTTIIKTPMTTTPDLLKERNRKCLEYLLENRIIEYYYPPLNDDTFLNFSIKGIVANAKLGPNFPEPLLALRNPPPSSSYDEKIVPRSLCSEDLVKFLPSITSAEYDTFRNIFKFLKHIAKLIDMPYYLDYGSLLGHVRFNGRPSPWDDDMDIAIDFSKRSLFEKTWTLERNRLNLTRPGHFSPQLSSFKDRIKIFDDHSPKMVQFKYPFVDIFFFNSGIEDFYDIPEELLTTRNFSDAFYSIYTHNLPVETMLPFKRKRFLGVELNIPARPQDFLKDMNFIISVCMSVSYSHRYEKNTKPLGNVPCRSLLGFYDINVLEYDNPLVI